MTPDGNPMGRPRKLTERAVIEAVRTEGFTGLTVPAVAERVGVSVIAVYRYTPTRAELLSLAWTHVVVNAQWPFITGTWRDMLREQGIAFWIELATSQRRRGMESTPRCVQEFYRELRSDDLCWSCGPQQPDRRA